MESNPATEAPAEPGPTPSPGTEPDPGPDSEPGPEPEAEAEAEPELFKEIDRDGQGYITFAMFVRWWKHKEGQAGGTSKITDDVLIEAMAQYRKADLDVQLLRHANVDRLRHLRGLRAGAP